MPVPGSRSGYQAVPTICDIASDTHLQVQILEALKKPSLYEQFRIAFRRMCVHSCVFAVACVVFYVAQAYCSYCLIAVMLATFAASYFFTSLAILSVASFLVLLWRGFVVPAGSMTLEWKRQ